MKIEILGIGCPRCHTLEDMARKAAKELGLEAEFSKVTSLEEIVGRGVMMTPAMAVDGEVVLEGRLAYDHVKKALQQASQR